MHTYTLLVKGAPMHAHAQITLWLKGVMHRVTSAKVTSGETIFTIDIPDASRHEANGRIAEWFASDIHTRAPFPNGSLLHYASQPDTDLDPDTHTWVSAFL